MVRIRLFWLIGCIIYLVGASNCMLAQNASSIKQGLLYKAPQTFQKHSLFLELMGNGGLYSINYDGIWWHRTYQQKSIKVSTRLGIAYATNLQEESLLLPLENNILFSRNYLHHLELGLGGTWLGFAREVIVDKQTQLQKGQEFSLFARFGYRYQPSTGGFFFRIGFTPLLYTWSPFPLTTFKDYLAPWAAFGFGYTFKARKTLSKPLDYHKP